MSERLLIIFRPGEGALVRMLGLIERRGYSVQTISMEARSDSASMVVDIGARDSERRSEVLARQLARLIDVISVSLVAPVRKSAA